LEVIRSVVLTVSKVQTGRFVWQEDEGSSLLRSEASDLGVAVKGVVIEELRSTDINPDDPGRQGIDVSGSDKGVEVDEVHRGDVEAGQRQGAQHLPGRSGIDETY
jgi:hypothetical protein